MMLASTTSSKAGARPTVAARPIAPRRARAASAVVVRAEAAAEVKGSGIEKSVPSLKPVLDIEAIKGILPHR